MTRSLIRRTIRRATLGVVLAGVSLTAGCIPIPLLGKRDEPSLRTIVGGPDSSMPVRPGATREAVDKLVARPNYRDAAGTLEYHYFVEESAYVLWIMLLSPEGPGTWVIPVFSQGHFLVLRYDDRDVLRSARIVEEREGEGELRMLRSDGVEMSGPYGARRVR
jgi:hypothetical protein